MQQTPETADQLAEQIQEAPAAAPARFLINVPKSDEIICEVSSTGQFFWNKHTPEIIADVARWPYEYTGIRMMLSALWNIEKEPLDTKEAFAALRVAMSETLQPGTPEWDTELKYQIFRKGISYGRRYLLELNGPEFEALAPAFAALLQSMDGIMAASLNGGTVSVEAWQQLHNQMLQATVLMPTLNRLGKDCHHQLAPLSENGTDITGLICMHCRQLFDLYEPPVPPAEVNNDPAAAAPESAVPAGVLEALATEQAKAMTTAEKGAQVLEKAAQEAQQAEAALKTAVENVAETMVAESVPSEAVARADGDVGH